LRGTSAGGLSGGRCPGACAPTWPWTPWRWGCGPASTLAATSPGSWRTRTKAFSADVDTAIRYTQRLAEAGAVASVGSTGDSYDNALAEAFNSLFKAELVRHRGPWKGIDDLEIAVAEYVDWFNHRRLHGELGLVPPVEFETTYYTSVADISVPATVETSVPSLY